MFADGGVLSPQQVIDLQNAPVNHAPVVGAAAPNQVAAQSQALSVQLAANLFADVDAGDTLTWSVQRADGQALPAWLSFDAATRTLSGIAKNKDAGDVALQVRVTDLAGATASQNFTLTVTGTAGLVLTGTAAANVLYGGGGDDRIDGLAGIDRMVGGDGDDVYVVDNAKDTAVELADEGYDRIETTVSFVAPVNVEAITLKGTAGISATGNALDNELVGNTGSNKLDGGAGADRMLGGAGNDVYVVDNVWDVVVELASEGTDTVQASVSYALSDNVENLTLTGTAAINGTGNALNNVITGNDAANTLAGMDGNDTLKGGISADLLLGVMAMTGWMVAQVPTVWKAVQGNDTFIVDDAGDQCVELESAGTDNVQASVSYTLGDNIENLTLTGSAAINGTGNTLNNVITGNDASNVLAGLGGNDTLRGGLLVDALYGGDGNDHLDGGAGADHLEGGAGNDVYVVDDAGDVVVELADEGTDTVQASISWTLGNNLENLTLSGTAAVNGTGNALNNTITGNSASNLLMGLAGNDSLKGGLLADVLLGGDGNDRLDGGAGADRLEGGTGNDVYVVDDAGDLVIELADEGTDTVQASISWTLGDNLENLTLTGTAAIDGTGNALNNVITGNVTANTLRGLAGNDTLNGGDSDDVLDGGLGNDRLTGGLGADTYLFGRGDGQDTIVDTDATADVFDQLQFGADITQDQLWMRKVGNSLEISVIGTTDRVTVSNWYLGTNYHVEAFTLASGAHLLDSQVQNLVQAMAAFAPPAAGQTTLSASYSAALTPVIVANWQ